MDHHEDQQEQYSTDCQTRKRVQFSSEARLRIINAPPCEASNIWYGKEDYASFKRDCRVTLSLAEQIQRGDRIDSEDDILTVRGLEHFMARPDGTNLRLESRGKAFNLVWDEQEQQYDSGSFCDETISELYCSISLQCQIEAHALAVKHLHETEEEYRRESPERDDPSCAKAPQLQLPLSPMPVQRRRAAVDIKRQVIAGLA